MARNDLGSLLNEVVDDPEVTAAVKTLALDALAVASEMLSPNAAPHLRIQMVKSILPTLVRSLEKAPDGGDKDELRKRMEDLFAEVRGGVSDGAQL